jgi:hypothetical protein
VTTINSLSALLPLISLIPQACLVIALKGREGMDVKPIFVTEKMCEDMYLVEEVVLMEIKILRTLSWFLNGPTPKDFLEIFMELLPPDADKEVASILYEAAIKKSEASLLDYSLGLESPSRVALASLASLLTDMNLEQQDALKASTWMGRIGFTLGATTSSLPNIDHNVLDNEA